jgi:phenylacetate-coenzyme A ligase PaaK-like adenylate-forming protein
MTEFETVNRICRVQEPLSWTQEKTALMVGACREMASFHYQRSIEFRALCERVGFSPANLKNERDLGSLPLLGVTAMKHYLLLSQPIKESVLKLTSSGTRGQKTEIHFDSSSLERAQKMLDGVWGQEGLISTDPTSYLNFIYDPSQSKDLGISFTVQNGQRFAPLRDSFFALKLVADKWVFDAKQTEKKLEEYEGNGAPVRFMGVPSFLFEFMLGLIRKGKRFQLSEKSLVMTGGGWKAAEERKVTRDEFRAMISKVFGLPDERIRDGFGLAEHGSPYLECKNHRFHIPAFNRVFVREPHSLKLLSPGETGLLQFVTPFNSMMPNLSILSTDLGFVDVDCCKCGSTSPTFTVVGRGGTSKNKGCAITASEIVKRIEA